MQTNRFHDARLTAAVVISCLLLGAAYYLTMRTGASLPRLLTWFASLQPSVALANPVGGAAPSFLHAVATLVMVLYLQGRSSLSRKMRWATYSLSILALLLMEFSIGTVSLVDGATILLAAGVVLGIHRPGVVLRCTGAAPDGRRLPSGRIAPHPAMALLFGLSLWGALGSVPYEECALYDTDGACTETKRPAEPVYMSYTALRNAVRVTAPRPLDRINRLYVYGDYLFVNERNEGIHVIDNREPAEPTSVGFIRIPGNMEINIRNNYLYADSYVDLVTLDLSDPMNVREVDRQEDIFPYDAFQNIPYNISFSQTVLDHTRGVVVSYVE